MSLNATDPSDDTGPGILDVTLKSDKPLKYAKVEILTATGYSVYSQEMKPNLHEATFHMPEDLGPFAPMMTLKVLTKKPVDIKREDLLSAYTPGRGNRQVWKRAYDKVEILVNLKDPFRPTTERILEACPQFRILVMGKAGVGKSSLINKVFGITDALVSDSNPGDAEIDREFTSDKNPHLVLHDSRGLEPGEDDNFQIVHDFIKRRGEEDEVKRKLHAIWLCIKAPISGGRMIETGVEQFLQLKRDGKLGEVPIVVVFTKYDSVVTAEKLGNKRAGGKLTLEEVTKKANDKLKQDCFIPFEQAVGKDMPYLPVSVKSGYADTLNDLIKLTYDNVENYIVNAAIVAGISQKISAQVKVRTSIEVGKRRHWKELSSNADSRMTLEKYLDIVHEDIVTVWNMEDKRDLLRCGEFRKLMLGLTSAPEKATTQKTSKGRGAVKAIATVLSGAVGPIAMLIGIPTRDWIDERFYKTPDNLRRSMIYMVDLTIVMQNLFWIQNMLASRSSQIGAKTSGRVTVPIKCRFIKLALNLYIGTSDRELLLDKINRHKRNLYIEGVVDAKVNKTVDKVIDLIKEFTISDQDAFAEQNGAKVDKSWENVEDELWDISAV